MVSNDFIHKNWKRLTYASWVSKENHFFYMETPKVACSTIKVALQKICDFELPNDLMQIHYRMPPEKFVKNITDYTNDLDSILESDDIFKFCFVRSPYTRTLSAYKDKIVKSKGKFWDRYREQIISLNGKNISDQITFDDFLLFIESTPDNKRDIHWRTQTSLLNLDVFQYDFIGKQESFDTDFSYVLGRLVALNYRALVGNKVNSSNVEAKFPMTELQLQRIKIIYAKDFENFGY
jgi:hypothetical protein